MDCVWVELGVDNPDRVRVDVPERLGDALGLKNFGVNLTTLQPGNGGFLEATPLTSFVTMSLASMGEAQHPVAQRGVGFLRASVRPDGSWPIDTNLATWGTTLAVRALGKKNWHGA